MLQEICRWAVYNRESKCLVISDLMLSSGLSPLVSRYRIQMLLAPNRMHTSEELAMATHIWAWPYFLDLNAPPPPPPQNTPPPPHPPPSGPAQNTPPAPLRPARNTTRQSQNKNYQWVAKSSKS